MTSASTSTSWRSVRSTVVERHGDDGDVAVRARRAARAA